jgi:hypothetical protein
MLQEISQQQINFAALKWLLQWERKESFLHEAFQKEVIETASVQRAMSYFKVARNLTGIGKLKRHEKVKRYEEIGKTIKVIVSNANTGVGAINQLEKKLKKQFPDAGSLRSASSKLIWLSNRTDPIYDSQACKALNFKHGDSYIDYVEVWNQGFSENESRIQIACGNLKAIKKFMPKECDVDKQVYESWFQNRVFDMCLWELGQSNKSVD